MFERLLTVPWWARLSLALSGGALASLGLAPRLWWPALLVGVTLLTLLTLSARRWWLAALTGWGWGLGFAGLGVRWMQAIFVEAAVGLALLEASFYLLLGLLIFAVRHSPWWPPLVPAAWTLTEALFSRVPFNGFPWLRLGYQVVDTPLAGFLPFVGVAGVTFLSAALAQLVAAALLRPRQVVRVRHVLGGALLVVLLGGWALQGWRPADAGVGTVAVGYVQGDAPGGGIYGIGSARTTTINHLNESLNLAERVRNGQVGRPDFVVWPENGTDLDPTRDSLTSVYLRKAVAAFGVPLFVGTITDGPGANERQTTSLWIDPTDGVTARYAKRDIVPFGEWVPFRSVLEPLFPVVSYVGPQSVAGTTPGVVNVTAGGGPLRVGTAICFEVAFDSTMRDLPANGAEVIVVQSSNAMYLGTDQLEQQFAITRARAAELRREILVVTTTGVSGLIAADGSVTFSVPVHEPASGVVTLPRRTGITPAVVLGGWVEGAICLLAIGSLMWIGWRGRRLGSGQKAPDRP